MVLNSVSNVSKALDPLGSYEAHPLLSSTTTVQGWEPLRDKIRKGTTAEIVYIRDASQTYSGCKDLNEYLQKQAERNRQVQSVRGDAHPATEKEERLSVIAHYNYTLRFRSCGLSRGIRALP